MLKKGKPTTAHVCLGEFCKCRMSGKKQIIKDPAHNKARSQNQERSLAKDYKAAGFDKSRRIPMSGAINGLKGDVDPGEMFLAEAKQTRSGKLVIEPTWINKIAQEAKDAARDWILHAHVAKDQDNFTKVVVLDEAVFFDMIKQLRAYESEFNKGVA